jgi:hypothetical protein
MDHEIFNNKQQYCEEEVELLYPKTDISLPTNMLSKIPQPNTVSLY